jgi:hypothetical protein
VQYTVTGRDRVIHTGIEWDGVIVTERSDIIHMEENRRYNKYWYNTNGVEQYYTTGDGRYNTNDTR